jgi:hypothetical protein
MYMFRAGVLLREFVDEHHIVRCVLLVQAWQSTSNK